MPHVVALHFRPTSRTNEKLNLLGQEIQLDHIGCNTDLDVMAEKIRAYDGVADAIALVGVSRYLRSGTEKVEHVEGAKLFKIAKKTPTVDGAGVRAAMERWAVRLVDDERPGLWSRKRILFVPSINHHGLERALGQYHTEIRQADANLYDPNAPLLYRLSRMADQSFRLIDSQPGEPRIRRNLENFAWADILVGDAGTIRRYGPKELPYKTVVLESVGDEDIDAFRLARANTIVTTMPSLTDDPLARHSAPIFEACLVALREDKEAALTENTYLNLIADLEWQPGVLDLTADAEINRFAFVIHPLRLKQVHSNPRFKWTKHLPDDIVERAAGYVPPFQVGKITGVASPSTGQKIEGYLYTLGGTPKQLMRMEPSYVYGQLIKCARMAERKGARLMGLGAFTSVVGDAGISVANEADIGITSGNSLTVSATLETAKEAMVKMGHRLEDSQAGNVMVIGATGSIGSVCCRLLAQAVPNITLVAPRPEKLIALKRLIEEETPYAKVKISTSADDYVDQADLIVTTTTAFGQRIIDISKCKPGAVICDIARPPDITEEEADLRPDVLVIESGEILLPGEPDFGYDIGLPPGVAYACLAETALLALDGKFEDYTLGRNIEIDRVKEIYRLYKKHGLELSGIRSHGHFLTDQDLAEKAALAQTYRDDQTLFASVKEEAAIGLARIDAANQSKQPTGEKKTLAGRLKENRVAVSTAAATATVVGGLLMRRGRDGEPVTELDRVGEG